MHLEWYHYLLMFFAGILAGAVNTMAGSGSVFTLSVLIFGGLPVNIANGTNRIGTLAQCIIAIRTFQKNGLLPFKQSLKFTIPALFGALSGAIVATETSKDLLEIIVGIIMTILLLITIFEPLQYIKADLKNEKYLWLQYLSFFAIGFYGGFIQVGTGLFILVALGVLSSYNLVSSNAVKILIFTLFSLPVLLIFIYTDQVNWPMGIWVASGQAVGTFIAARFAVRSPNAGAWMKKILITMMVVTILKVFGVFELIHF
ncbi:MAG: hypothetical protein CMO01_06285 [Thalassobius sp.]|nr:hypothetical protein [Thalassovita sp.]